MHHPISAAGHSTTGRPKRAHKFRFKAGLTNRRFCARDRRLRVDRIRALPPYVFRAGQSAKAVARNAGAYINRPRHGHPDLPTPLTSSRKRVTLRQAGTDRYSSSKVHVLASSSAGRLLGRPLGVKLNPDTQIAPLLASVRRSCPRPRMRSTARGRFRCWCPIRAIRSMLRFRWRAASPSVPSDPTPDFFATALARDHALDPKRSRSWSASGEPPPTSPISTCLQGRSAVRESTASYPLRPPYAEVYFDVIRRRRLLCSGRARWSCGIGH